MQLIPFIVELDETVYDEAKEVLEKKGHTMEEALVLLLHYLIRNEQLPFDCAEVESKWAIYQQERKVKALEQLMHELEKGANSGPYIDEKDVYRMLRKEWWKGLNKVWKQGRIPKRLSAMHVFLKKQK